MKNIFQGLRYLHSEKSIIHRDIKPLNIIMMNPTKDISDLKIIDFGLSCKVRDIEAKGENKLDGTLLYQPPEQALPDQGVFYGKGIDMWACGVIMYELLLNCHPFYKKGMGEEDIRQKLREFTKLGCNAVLTEDLRIDQEPLDLLKQLLNTKPSQRIKVFDALNHPYLTGNPLKHGVTGLHALE
jgi:calcium/calmodulin-dependent serine protein kinase